MSTTPTAMPIGLSSMPSALGRTTFSRPRPNDSLRPRRLAGGRIDRGNGVFGMGGKGNALGFGHVVQHVF